MLCTLSGESMTEGEMVIGGATLLYRDRGFSPLRAPDPHNGPN